VVCLIQRTHLLPFDKARGSAGHRYFVDLFVAQRRLMQKVADGRGDNVQLINDRRRRPGHLDVPFVDRKSTSGQTAIPAFSYHSEFYQVTLSDRRRDVDTLNQCVHAESRGFRRVRSREWMKQKHFAYRRHHHHRRRCCRSNGAGLYTHQMSHDVCDSEQRLFAAWRAEAWE